MPTENSTQLPSSFAARPFVFTKMETEVASTRYITYRVVGERLASSKASSTRICSSVQRGYHLQHHDSPIVQTPPEERQLIFKIGANLAKIAIGSRLLHQQRFSFGKADARLAIQKATPCRRILLLPLVVSSLLLSVSAAADDKPNILWITSEDNGISWVSCYGGNQCQDTGTSTNWPREGFRYTHCFDNAAVCAPTRSCWITGMYAISNGTQADAKPQRDPARPDQLLSRSAEEGRATTPPIQARRITTSEDVTTRTAGTTKAAREIQYGWRLRKPGQPFFAVVNIGDSHESSAHGDVENTRNDPAKMKLYSYHPDLPVIRKNYAKYADAVENMDREGKGRRSMR